MTKSIYQEVMDAMINSFCRNGIDEKRFWMEMAKDKNKNDDYSYSMKYASQNNDKSVEAEAEGDTLDECLDSLIEKMNKQKDQTALSSDKDKEIVRLKEENNILRQEKNILTEVLDDFVISMQNILDTAKNTLDSIEDEWE